MEFLGEGAWRLSLESSRPIRPAGDAVVLDDAA
jgi:hypothetical protein